MLSMAWVQTSVTFPALFISESYIKIKILFSHFFVVAQGFIKALKAFIKPWGTTKKCENKNLTYPPPPLVWDQEGKV